MSKEMKKAVFYLLKIVVSALIIYFIMRRINFRELLDTMSQVTIQMILVMLILTLLKHFTQYKNWSLTLRINPLYQINRREIVESYIIGIALRFLIPGGHGTFGKALLVTNTSKKATLFSVAMEKLFQTWMTWFFASLASLTYFMQVWIGFKLTVLTIIALFPIILYYMLGLSASTRKVKLEYYTLSPKIIIFQYLYVLLTFIQYWYLFRRFIPIDFLSSAKLVSLIQFANTIPITISGLGLRESFAVYFARGFGLSAAQAVSSTLTVFVFNDLMVGIVGAILLLMRKNQGVLDK